MPNYEGRTVPAEALADALEELKGLQSGRIHPESQSADEAVNGAETALRAAQPAPSVPAGAEVAAVLAKYWRFSLDRDYVRSADADLAELLDDLVGSQRQAATGARAAGGDLSDEAPDRAADAAHAAMFDGDLPLAGIERELWRGVVRAVLAAIPSTPSVHGVAELLAECARRSALPQYPSVMTCDEIVRYLAPGGADGGNSDARS